MNKHQRQILLSFFLKFTTSPKKTERDKQLTVKSLKHIGLTTGSSTVACFVSTMLWWPALSQEETSELWQSTDWLIGNEGIRECIKVQAPLYVHLI